MLSSVLVAYYLHHFQYPLQKPAQHIRIVEQRGNLTVNTTSAGYGSIPPGAQRVEMLRMNLSADCTGNVPIRSINLQRRGLGFNTDISDVYVMHRGRRVSSARPITQRSGNVDLSLRDLTIPACMDENIEIYADFSSSASPAGEHTLVLRSIDAGKSTVRIDQRNTDFTPTLRTAGGGRRGSLSVQYLRLNNRVRYGSRQRLLRFTLEADSMGDQRVSQITFTNNGSASDSDLQNLFVEFRNRRISTLASQMDDDRVTLVLDPPFTIPSGSTLQFGLRADVRASRSRTIQFRIEEEADIVSQWQSGR